MCTKRGRSLGPERAFTKLVLCAAEQGLFDSGHWPATRTSSSIRSINKDWICVPRTYFSRIVTIYGGSQQMQLDTVARADPAVAGVTIVEDADDLFLSSAQDALRSTDGDDALRMLGWRDLLGSLDADAEARLGVLAYFRAQGRELGSSGALGELMAQPYAEALGNEHAVTASVERQSARGAAVERWSWEDGPPVGS